MLHKFRYLLLVVTALTLVARMSFPVLAQNPTGSIRGTVTDQQGDVIQNATVTVTNKATGDVRKVDTGDDGIYLVSTLLPGEYEVKVEAQGFSTQILTLVVQVGNTTPGDASLRVGTASEIVDIVAEAPIIDKQNFKIDGVINRQKIDALPLNGRNFLQLALLEPGVGVTANNPGAQNNLFSVSIGGAPSALTRLTVDGASILDPVCGGAAQNFSTESIQEFQISTFNFDLSTGVTSVGAINIVSRTGTNDFHGNAFIYYRDNSFSALSTFFRPDRNFDPEFHRYQYGGSIGGPIKQDRAFFFGNVERLDQEAAISSFVTAGNALTRNALAGFNTTTTSPYEGWLFNVRGDIKINDKNNMFTRYSRDQNDVFAPDSDNSLPSNWRVNGSEDDNFQVGVTTLFTQNLVNDARFNFQNIVNIETIPTSAECPANNPGCIGLGGPQIRVSGSNLRLGNTINAPQNRDLQRYQTTDNVNWQKGSHRIRFGGEWEHNYGKGAWAFLDPALIVVHDPVTVLGVNQLVAAQINAQPLPPPVRAGLIALLTIPLPAAFTTPGGRATYNDLLQLPVVAGFTAGVTIPLVGIGDPSQPPPFNTEIARQSNRYRLYGQDSWQITPSFTLSYGASYQYETNLQNHDLPKPAFLQSLIGEIGRPPKDDDNIAPSVGFAWDVGNKGKTVIRGGAGIYYDTVLFVTRLRERAAIGPAGNGRLQVPGSFFLNTIAFPQPPVALPLPLSLINVPLGIPVNFGLFPTKLTAANFLTIISQQVPAIQQRLSQLTDSGLTNIDVLKTATDLLDPNLESPYSEQISLGFQHQLPHNMAISADFVLRNRVHTLFQNDRNLFGRPAAFGGPVLPVCSPAQLLDPAARCSSGPISVIQSSGRENYKALLLKLDKRFSNRYQLTVSYALSSLRGFFTGEDLTNVFGFDGFLPADARHRLTISGVVDLPLGFQASLIASYVSKSPFNARVPDTIDLNGDGTTNDTLPGLDINSLNRGTSEEDLRRLVNEFNARFAGTRDSRNNVIPALVLPTRISFGDDFQSEDIRVTKTFKFGERYALQGFVEVFNILNISNLTFDTSTQNIGNSFGQPSGRVGQTFFGTGGPRALQFGGRFSF